MAQSHMDDAEEIEDEESEAELFARIERAFRTDRSRIRTCEDLQELRALRSEYQEVESNERFSQVGRIRARDLVELIDDRITDIKAKRLAERRE